MMDMQSFRKYAAIYGGDLSRWPNELLTAAAATLKSEPDAARILSDEFSIDQALATLQPVAMSASLRTRLLNIPDRLATTATPLFWLKPKHLVPALALCSMLGMIVGVNDPIRQSWVQQKDSAWIFAPDQTVSLD